MTAASGIEAASERFVGIFWMVPDATGVLVADRTSLADAERYGAFLTHPRGHYDVWSAWQGLGPAGLSRRGLPAAIAWHEYEDCPRGRIVFNTEDGGFVIYADRSLQTPTAVDVVKARFGLTAARTVVRGDPHYRTSGPR